MPVLPLNYGSTTFNNRITSYELLAQRVRNMLGEPLIQVEISDAQMYQCIDYACEFFTKFAGTTEEFLIFRSDLYIPGQGLPIGRLINVTPDLGNNQITEQVTNTTITEYNETIGDGINRSFVISHNLNSPKVITELYNAFNGQQVYASIANIDNNNLQVSFSFAIPPSSFNVVVLNGLASGDTPTTTYQAVSSNSGWDFDMNSYRKVVDVYSFAEGNNSGINTLFSIEHTIAQQAYFGHLLGNVGYDLITWQALKGWLDLRDKVLALTPYLRFYPEEQLLKIIPEPGHNSTPYYGLVGCHMQKPIKDIVSQLWVYRYVMAQVKMVVAHVRGKYSGTNLFGGQVVSSADLMSQGLAERTALEEELRTNKSADWQPPKFFIG